MQASYYQMRSAQRRHDNMLPPEPEIKEDDIQERHKQIQIDDDSLIRMLGEAFGNIDCCAVSKAKESNPKLFMALSDALSEFTYEVAREDLKAY